jgi:formylmethanofuran--tetrahydromethanopterin N-formyltransferase
MEIRGVFIQDTFAEAFGMRAARLVITARSDKWAREAALGHRLQVRGRHRTRAGP